MRNFNRDDRRGGGRSFGGKSLGRRDSGPVTMHQSVCSNCGQSCEVPFQPTGSKPVFCNNCFRDKRGGGRDDRDNSRPSQLDEINAKLDRILATLKA